MDFDYNETLDRACAVARGYAIKPEWVAELRALEWNLFYPWVLAPYVVLLATYVFPRVQSRARLVVWGVLWGLLARLERRRVH